MYYKKISDHEKHELNPFFDEFITDTPAPITRKEYVQAERSATRQEFLVNGETKIEQAFLRIRKLDAEQFVRFFFSRLEILWDISKPAMRILTYIFTTLDWNKDFFYLDFKEVKNQTGYKGDNSILNALAELAEKGVIARSHIYNKFFINPMVLFKGDRIVYAEMAMLERGMITQEDVINILRKYPKNSLGRYAENKIHHSTLVKEKVKEKDPRQMELIPSNPAEEEKKE